MENEKLTEDVENTANETYNTENEAVSNTSDTDNSNDTSTEDLNTEEIIISSELTAEPKKKKKISKKTIITISAVLAVIVLIVASVSIIKVVKSNNEIKNVISMIDKLEPAETASDVLIESANTAFHNLTEKQQEKVSNLHILLLAQKAKMDKELYKGHLLSFKKKCKNIGDSSKSIFEETRTVWSNAIWKKYDDYNKGNYDFNTALSNLYSKNNTVMLADMVIVLGGKNTLDSEMKDLANDIPNEYQSAHQAAVELYSVCVNMSETASNPTGSYNSYSSKTTELENTYAMKYSIFDALVPGSIDDYSNANNNK